LLSSERVGQEVRNLVKTVSAGVRRTVTKNVVFERYGAHPSVTYFESPVIVDSQTQEILSYS
jgi:hypothetical protein